MTSIIVQKHIFKLRHASSADIIRPSLGGVWLDFRNKRAIATDGHIMAWQPIEYTDLDAFFIPSSVCLAVLKTKSDQVEIDIDTKELYLVGSKLFCRQEEDRTDSFNSIINEARAVHTTSNNSVVMGLDPWLLVKLAKALGRTEKGREKLKLRFIGNDVALHVLNGDDVTGLIMPMKI